LAAFRLDRSPAPTSTLDPRRRNICGDYRE
jgi:hypothetical protein